MNYRDLQAIETKENIFQKAYELFEKKGYDKVSINEICQELHLTKGAFYYHFNSKADILISKYKKLEKSLLDYYESIASYAPKDKLSLILDRFATHFSNNFQNNSLEQAKTFFKLQIDAHYENSLGESAIQKHILAMIISEGQVNGDFRKDISAEILAEIINRYKFGLYIEWCMLDGNTDIDSIGIRDFNVIIKLLTT